MHGTLSSEQGPGLFAKPRGTNRTTTRKDNETRWHGEGESKDRSYLLNQRCGVKKIQPTLSLVKSANVQRGSKDAEGRSSESWCADNI